MLHTYGMLILYNKVDTNSVAQLVSYLISIIPITHKMSKNRHFCNDLQTFTPILRRESTKLTIKYHLVVSKQLQGASILLFFCIKVIQRCYDSLKTYIV